jgi:hypothetical protein
MMTAAPGIPWPGAAFAFVQARSDLLCAVMPLSVVVNGGFDATKIANFPKNARNGNVYPMLEESANFAFQASFDMFRE